MDLNSLDEFIRLENADIYLGPSSPLGSDREDASHLMAERMKEYEHSLPRCFTTTPVWSVGDDTATESYGPRDRFQQSESGCGSV